jgi:ankyrin repeat protein
MLYMLAPELILHIFSYLKDDRRLPSYRDTFPPLHNLMLEHPHIFFSLSYLCKTKFPYSILQAHTRTSPSNALILAAAHNYYSHLPSLLKHTNCDPTFKKNSALREAITKNNPKVVELLLQDTRINPADNDNEAIGIAIGKNRAEITKLLLADPRVGLNNNLLYNAIERGYFDVVQVLLSDYRIHPSMDDNEPLYIAATEGHAHIVHLLVTNNRFVYTDRYFYCMHAAVNKGHYDTRDVLYNHNNCSLTDCCRLSQTHPCYFIFSKIFACLC